NTLNAKVESTPPLNAIAIFPLSVPIFDLISFSIVFWIKSIEGLSFVGTKSLDDIFGRRESEV
ncbi:MAG: hypothetical protein EB161_09370, partial [Nitrosopumilaceae archaeon]|nr:hypothetical protein [Nitrosopumilaceae archaeon]